MKYILSCLFLITTCTTFSQPLRFHFSGGFANYNGDLQPKKFTLNQAKGVVAAGATFNLSEKFALRSDYSFAKVGADDKLSSNNQARNLNFTSLIQELSLMGEYDIFSTYERKLTPYVFAGIGVFRFSPYTKDENGNKVYLQHLRTEGQETSQYPDRKIYNKVQMNIPFGAGAKYAISDDVHLAFELSFRKLFTDYLDDVSTSYADENVLTNEVGPKSAQFAFRGDELTHNPRTYPAGGTARGNPAYKDSYYFGQVRLSFRMNWFDNNSGYGGRGKNRLGCPTRF
ncbi:DUF6089 family protein [Aridibaculum aurantiacum]|uniref:DUF6089 family protein n=1 Tax=Aridibaculum aurantiacum TaxID=2810307 RepID=UPI001A972290|nr:DUF6089 family protein [Aridibaculum aurantiacum]